MNKHKQKNLENKGWTIGDAKQFLALSPEEASYVELKLVLGENLQDTRRQKKLTQEELAKLIKSSQ